MCGSGKAHERTRTGQDRSRRRRGGEGGWGEAVEAVDRLGEGQHRGQEQLLQPGAGLSPGTCSDPAWVRAAPRGEAMTQALTETDASLASLATGGGGVEGCYDSLSTAGG